jgi:threonine dehydratase
MLLLLERAKMVVEPAGALTVAALLAERVRVVPGTVAVVSGGNVDIKVLSDVIERGMIRSARYMHFFSTVPDRPGGLAALLQLIAAQQGNVINVVHNRVSVRVPFGATGVEMLVEVRDAAHIAAVRGGLAAEGYAVEMLD